VASFLFLCKVRIVDSTIAFVKTDRYFGVNKTPLNEKNNDCLNCRRNPAVYVAVSFLDCHQFAQPLATI